MSDRNSNMTERNGLWTFDKNISVERFWRSLWHRDELKVWVKKKWGKIKERKYIILMQKKINTVFLKESFLCKQHSKNKFEIILITEIFIIIR